jgi:cytoskeleton protein RodZ
VAGTGIGDELRRERLRQKLTLDDIVQRTRISPRSLHAIEDDEFDRLPGTVFTRNFVRIYALELKMDADAMVARLPRVDIDSAPLPNPPAGIRRRRRDPRLTSALASVLWLLTAAGAGEGAWYYFNHQTSHTVARVAAAPAPVTSGNAPVDSGATQLPQTPAVSNATTATADMTSAPAQNAFPQSGAQSGQQPGAPDNSRPVQVILSAREAAWVQVSADGHTAFVGMLHPHDTRAIAADAQVNVLTGNAGGLDISLNGKPLDPIGPSGQVRTVRLTAAGPQFVPRTPPVSSPL